MTISRHRVSYGELLRTCRAGGLVEGHGRRTIDAEVIRRCCAGVKASAVDPRGLRLRNVHVVGPLDLAGTTVEFPLYFAGCVFDSAPILENSQVASLAIVGSPALPGLLANGIRVRGDLNLSRSMVTGAHTTTASTSKRAAIWLCESQIGGRLLCVDTIVDTVGERAIQADRMQVGGTVRLLHDFTANAEVRMVGARIDGSLDLTGAQVNSSGGLALDLGEAQIGGSVFLIPASPTGRRPTIGGRIDLGNARVGGQLLVRDATVVAPSPVPVAGPYGSSRTTGSAINAPRLSVGGDLTLEGSCRIEGGIDFSLSDLGSFIVAGKCALSAPGTVAVDLANANVRSRLVLSPGTLVEGEMLLVGLQVHGNLLLSGVRLEGARDGRLITGSGLTVDGDLRLAGMNATGGWVRFRGATVKGEVDASGATFDNAGAVTLSLYDCMIGGSVLLWNGFRSTGAVLLNRITIGGRLDCREGSFLSPVPSSDRPGGHALEAVSATARGGLYLGWTEATPSVDFTNATTPILADYPDRWPPRFVISGLTYDRFAHPDGTGNPVAWNRRRRCEWLGGQAAYDAGPYEQLASVFRRHGYSSDAEAILIAARHAARRSGHARPHPLQRALDATYGWTVGYGFRPGRVLWLLLVLLVAVAGSLSLPVARDSMRAVDERGNVYAADGRFVTVDAGDAPSRISDATPSERPARPDACGEGQVRCFNPALYAIDTVVPLISLGQRTTWYPNAKAAHGGFVEWWLNLATLIGWLLSTVFALSFARLGRTT